MNKEILEIIGTVLAALAVGLLAYVTRVLLPAAEEWLSERIGASRMEQLAATVASFVTAAEQLYKRDDEDGSFRKAYVVAQLKKLGIIVTDQVNAMIEAAVYALPHGEGKK